MRARHHKLARLLADGRSNTEAAYAVGFAPSSVHSLASDPAFKELVEYYKVQVVEQYLDVHAKMADIASTAADVLAERLEGNPDRFTNEDLRKLLSDYGTLSRTSVSANVSNGGISISVNFVSPATPQAMTIDNEPSAGTSAGS
jgi:hypothetical protein